jgi:hypothetical protein
MKTTHILALAAALLATSTLQAGEDGHGHSHAKKEAGPNGGRLITSIDPHAEFFVTADRKIQITFVGEGEKPVAPADQVVAVTTGERMAPVKLTFVKAGEFLLSEQTIPDGNRLPVVVQIKATPDSKQIVERFTLDLSVCPGCKLAEYACTCDHTH